ncbi:hypothetical protein GCM10009867_36760 [Pedococcus aerophilus]|uniref:Uncharacterized protein n=1 Tax=Pedococcus aerophilus TaxID=436356 RepID=A0ABN3UX78_9MICO
MDGAADRVGDGGPGRRRTTVLALGVGIAVDVEGDRAAELHDALAHRWSCCRSAPTTPVVATVRAVLDSDPRVTEAADTAGLASRPRLDDLLQLVTREVTVAAIDAVSGEHLLLHAACLADPVTGRATVLVAAGGTGKTTAAQVLGPGRWYVTDETVAVRADRSVVPYPKPLSVRRNAVGDHKDEVAPPDLELAPAPATAILPVAQILLLDRVQGLAGRPVPTMLSTLDAIESLVPHTSHLTDLHRPLHRLAELVEAVGGAKLVRYTEAADLAPLLSGAT